MGKKETHVLERKEKKERKREEKDRLVDKIIKLEFSFINKALFKR